MVSTRVIKGNWKIIVNLILYFAVLIVLTLIPIWIYFSESAGIVFWSEVILALIAVFIKALSEFKPEYHAKFKWFWQKFGGILSLFITTLFEYVDSKKKRS